MYYMYTSLSNCLNNSEVVGATCTCSQHETNESVGARGETAGRPIGEQERREKRRSEAGSVSDERLNVAASRQAVRTPGTS